MVCETPRLRSLLVSRRGGFLEDPFFRDAWGDYNNAVRRIVDRFNHGGMFAPRERLRDSHYHSMYRTLRNARISLNAQSARIKDEGEVYKLVMDVREFLGGDITVRTAGGTLSVRGRLETGPPNHNNNNNDDGNNNNNDADSVSSRASSSSARTLHRRFTLPPDADGEKVASVLSRDAVLTVTIPKRTDVRVIPVKVEGEEQPGGSAAAAAAGSRSGIKRHSATQPDHSGPTPSKRSQDFTQQGTGMGGMEADKTRHGEHYSRRERDNVGRSRGRDEYRSRERGESERRFGERSRDRGTERSTRFGERSRERGGEPERTRYTESSRDRDPSKGKDETGRRGSDIFLGASGSHEVDPEVRRRSYPNNDTNSRQSDNTSRRRSREMVEEEPAETFGQRSRRRTSKYEEAKEIHIPICIESDGSTNKIQPVSSRPEDIEDSRTTKAPQEPSNASQYYRAKMDDGKSKPLNASAPPSKDSFVNNAHEKENIKPASDKPKWTYSRVYEDNKGEATDTQKPVEQGCKTNASSGKMSDLGGGGKHSEPEVKLTTPEGKSITHGLAETLPHSKPTTYSTGMKPCVVSEAEGLTNGEAAMQGTPITAASGRKPQKAGLEKNKHDDHQPSNKSKSFYSNRPDFSRGQPKPDKSKPESNKIPEHSTRSRPEFERRWPESDKKEVTSDRSKPRQDGAKDQKKIPLSEQNDNKPQENNTNTRGPDLLPGQTGPQKTDNTSQQHNHKDYLTKPSTSPESRPRSPFGGVEVKVEKRQSDMEGDMFKDCWQNFSSTLQDVLSRLQELSAELSHAKPLQTVTSDSNQTSPKQSSTPQVSLIF
ncbi:hypothetical protein Pcinc_005063 [Petrolisthes cinctipes]|uniref:SHSP domain-containing protein n=1 Tax=Petrolisthes cinctipes TaxID=88211 RepID=A0AAE1GFM5_PETCI|nr:hypothetical protein Pcinc_005063 [Petrolisthes cinctipes]